jgi:hypothetical protein
VKQKFQNILLAIAVVLTGVFISAFTIETLDKEPAPPLKQLSYEKIQAINALEDMRDWVYEDLAYVEEDSVLTARLQAYINNIDYAIDMLNNEQ